MSEGAAERLATVLAKHGTSTVFGVPGGGPNLDVIGAMAAEDIRFVLAHGETAACIMASVHGYLTDTVSAAIVTRGPGAASAANGAAQATLDRHPLLVVTDTVPSANAARIPHQRIDQPAMFSPLCKASFTLAATTDQEAIRRAVELAVAAPAGAVHLDCDLQADATLAMDGPAPDSRTIDRATDGSAIISVMNSAADDVLDAIAKAERPVVIVGIGATAGQSLSSDLIAYGAPVLATYQAIGVVPTEHAVAGGLFTNGAAERPLLESADLIITIGLDPVEPIPALWTYDAPVVSITNAETKDPYMPIAEEVVGDIAAIVACLGDHSHGWSATAGADHRRSVREAMTTGDIAATSQGISPLELVQIAAEAAPPDAITTVDAGAHFLAIMPFWPVQEPKKLLISNGLATMGYAVPAAIGAALAAPGQPVLCLVGDGGLGMTVAELETIARLDLPITVVVFNDSALSLIKIKQRDGHGESEVVSYRETDFAAVAGGFGIDAARVSEPDTLRSALSGGWDRPRLLDVAVDPGSYSHLMTVTRG